MLQCFALLRREAKRQGIVISIGSLQPMYVNLYFITVAD